tara:strand:- start:1920 stop:3221 length:1302 start_codon:yes stop_codon:yes gene_type:complete
VNKYKSWNNYPNIKSKSIEHLSSSDKLDFKNDKNIAYGLGRSYGDVCLNENGNIVVTTNFNKLIEIDEINGTLHCESGISIKQILNVIAPMGWFLPVVPGTRNITIGGAIANDIHGKNHHKVGSFGNFVQSINLQRSNGEILTCSENENYEYLKATVGGMGLTGIILSAKVKLKKIDSQYVDVKTQRFDSLEDYFKINTHLEENNEYSVSWVDCLLKDNKGGLRGVYLSGNHSNKNLYDNKVKKDFKIKFPFTPPFSFVNNLSMKVINETYYRINKNSISKPQHFKPFFFPLDIVDNWGKAYGRKGFLQYQFVVPNQNSFETIQKILDEIKKNNQIPALGVLKAFGSIQSIGYMSFPREGLTLALDFRIKGKDTFKFLERLDKIVIDNNGSLYPAKDARMSPDTFVKSFKNLENFKKYVDPKFSSSFWRRVNI